MTACHDAIYEKVHKKGVRDMYDMLCLYADANNPEKTQQREEACGSGRGTGTAPPEVTRAVASERAKVKFLAGG